MFSLPASDGLYGFMLDCTIFLEGPNDPFRKIVDKETDVWQVDLDGNLLEISNAAG
jgi:hypothetical protein